VAAGRGSRAPPGARSAAPLGPRGASATVWLKGVTLGARDNGRDLRHAINLCEEELSRQVKRDREKRRGRRKGAPAESIRTATAPDLEGGTQAAF